MLQIAIRQHDQTKRLCETLAERRQRDSEMTEIKVLAKVVDDNDDHIGAFSYFQITHSGNIRDLTPLGNILGNIKCKRLSI